MSAATAFMGFPLQKVAQLSGVQIVATPSPQIRKSNKLRQGFILSFQILSTLSTKLIPNMPTPLAVTRSARRVSNAANVPRLGLRPSLLLDLAKPQVHAALDTQHAPLVAGGYFKQRQLSGIQIVATPSRQFRVIRLDKALTGCHRSHVGRGAGFLGSDSNIHAKHPPGPPEGRWILESDPNKPGHTNRICPRTALNPQLLEGGTDE